MSKLSYAFIIGDKVHKLSELLAGAAALADKVCAVVVGTADDAETAVSLGAQTVFLLEKKPGVPFEDYAQSIAKIIAEHDGKRLVLLPTGKACKCLAAKLGARLDTALVNEAEAIEIGEAVLARHMVYGGLAHATEEFTAPVSIVTVGGGVFEELPADTSRTGEIKNAEFVQPSHPIKLLETHPKQGSSVELGKAKRVVCVGRGIAGKDDIALADKLAALIGAEVGCSRPIAEGEHWMETERYIGVSGIMLKCDVYFALGVSGQIQHMVGANSCKTIIAVNKDKAAPIFKYTDHGIVGDLYKIVPKLLEAFKA